MGAIKESVEGDSQQTTPCGCGRPINHGRGLFHRCDSPYPVKRRGDEECLEHNIDNERENGASRVCFLANWVVEVRQPAGLLNDDLEGKDEGEKNSRILTEMRFVEKELR